jgi:hypothetical protein
VSEISTPFAVELLSLAKITQEKWRKGAFWFFPFDTAVLK